MIDFFPVMRKQQIKWHLICRKQKEARKCTVIVAVNCSITTGTSTNPNMLSTCYLEEHEK